MTLAGAVAPLRRAARGALARMVNPFDPPLVILLYHRVCDLEADPHQLAVAPSRFRAQMERLRARLPVIRLDQPWPRRDRPAAAVTFDDGYADNRIEALPILESLGIPATFFITTGNVESGREFWWDDLARLVGDGDPAPASSGARPGRFILDDAEHGGDWPGTSVAERERLHRELHARMKRVDGARRERWLSQLRDWAGAGRAGRARASHRPLDLDELRELAASPCATIGAHTVTHPRLASLGAAEQRREIASSRATLEAWLGREVTVFSYPFGERADFTGESVALCRAAGFRRTATNVPGTCHRWTDPQRLPRHVVRDWPSEEFERRLEGFLRS